MTMTETSLNDSYLMMVLSVLAMIFLPASFIAVSFDPSIILFATPHKHQTLFQSVFGINMKELNLNTVLARYFEIAIPLTAITVFFYMVSHRRSYVGSMPQLVWTDRA